MTDKKDIFSEISDLLGSEISEPETTLVVHRYDITPMCDDHPLEEECPRNPQKSINLPHGARFLHAFITPAGPVQSWWLVDPSAPILPATIAFQRTGTPTPATWQYLTTLVSYQFPVLKAAVDHLFLLPPSSPS